MFRKDGDGATFDYQITDAYLELFHYGAVGGFTTRDINASFDFEIYFEPSVSSNSVSSKVFDQHAAMSSQIGNSPTNALQGLLTEATGPLTSSLRIAGIDGLNRPHEARLSFDPFSGSIDLSSVPVGGVFEVLYLLELNASGSGGETEAIARFSDPADLGGGILTTTSGVTPVPEPTSAWLVGAGLFIALSVARTERRL